MFPLPTEPEKEDDGLFRVLAGVIGVEEAAEDVAAVLGVAD